MNTKIIAYYLPAYHEIDENNQWYGKGFTEWDNTKKGKKLYKKHYQPRIPLNENYYDLSNIKVMEEQAELANEYGVYGFCFYHYWFLGKKILEKPAENLLGNSGIKINFCFAWANEEWRKTWHDGKGESELLIDQKYGFEDDWVNHYNYLNKFFKDKRYIKVDNKPMLLIYRANKIPCFDKMIELWNKKAINDGFKGIYYICMISNQDQKEYKANATVDFEPGLTAFLWNWETKFKFWRLKRKLICKLMNIDFLCEYLKDVIDYDAFYQTILKRHKDKNSYYGVFCDWDNTPRKGKRGWSFKNVTSEKFGFYLNEIIENSRKEDKEYIFLFAWNEWGEGAYLEPDMKREYGFLKEIKTLIVNNRNEA